MCRLSVHELRHRLRELQVDPSELSGCIEREDFEALYERATVRRNGVSGAGISHTEGTKYNAQNGGPSMKSNGNPRASTSQSNAASNTRVGRESSGEEFTTTTLWILLAGVALCAFGLMGGDAEVDVTPSSPATFTAFLEGGVAQVHTLEEYNEILRYHKEDTGLPVVVDFYSRGCGPCRMIAPIVKQLAKEMAGRAVFVEVDVNRNYYASRAAGVRAMPTFQFHSGGKLRASFSGADSRRLKAISADLAAEAARAGTFLNQEVTARALRQFYQEHDVSKVADAARLAQEYNKSTALLIRVLKTKYGAAPPTSTRRPIVDSDIRKHDEVANDGVERARNASAISLGEASVAQLKAALRQRLASGGGGAKLVSGSEHELDGDSQSAGDLDATEDDDGGSLFSDVFATSAQFRANSPAKVVVLGGGPAGLSAALYAARAGLKPVVVAPRLGGQLEAKGVDVENYPGVDGSTGPFLVARMRRQAVRAGATLVADAAISVDLARSPFEIALNESGTRMHTLSMIIATGANSRWLGVPGEMQFRGQGVSSCATCDGFLYRGQHALVIGGGDTAMEEALVLARTCSHVTLVHRGTKLRASKTLAERVLAHTAISVLFSTVVEKFEGDDTGDDQRSDDGGGGGGGGDGGGGGGGRGLTHAHLVSTASGERRRLAIAAAFVAIGHEPNTALFAGQIELRSDKYVNMNSSGRSTRTSVPGIFACGDVADPTYRQAVTSAGSGAAAALDAERWLSETGVAD